MQADELAGDALDEQTIIDYLRAHPDFFSHHKNLLTELNLPHASGRTVSLVEHQVAIMRERNVEMRRRMNELLEAARLNDSIFAKTRSLTLALLDAKTLHELNEVLATHVLVDFDADFVCCHVHGFDHSLDHLQNHPGEFPFAHLFNGSTPVCTTLREAELKQIFPASNHGDAGSAVLLPMHLSAGDAALCIGSRDPHHFSSDMDTLFVTYIADVLSKVLTHL
jgi:uncharacterized protein YigA (DUF484 family)